MTCPTCGNRQCYVCSKTVTQYEHFGEDKPCKLYDNTVALHDREVKDAEKAARAKIIAENPDISEEDLMLKLSEKVERDYQKRLDSANRDYRHRHGRPRHEQPRYEPPQVNRVQVNVGHPFRPVNPIDFDRLDGVPHPPRPLPGSARHHGPQDLAFEHLDLDELQRRNRAHLQQLLQRVEHRQPPNQLPPPPLQQWQQQLQHHQTPEQPTQQAPNPPPPVRTGLPVRGRPPAPHRPDQNAQLRQRNTSSHAHKARSGIQRPPTNTRAPPLPLPATPKTLTLPRTPRMQGPHLPRQRQPSATGAGTHTNVADMHWR